MKTIQLIGNFVKKEIDTTIFQMQLLQNGTAYNFSETATVRLIIESASVNVVNKLVEIKDYANGIVEFDINEKLKDGSYNCEFIVNDNEQVMTFPTSGYQTFQINRNLERDTTGETILPSEYEVIIERIESIENTLPAKANLVHTHTKSEITDFAHGHEMDDVEGLIDAFEDQQGLIDAIDLETDEIQETLVAHENDIADNVARLDYIQNSVTATETLIDKVNALPDNAGNFVEVAKVQGNTVQNILGTHVKNSVQYTTDYTFNGDYVTINSINNDIENIGYSNVYASYDCPLIKPNTTYTVIFEELLHPSKKVLIRDGTNGVNFMNKFIPAENNMVTFTTTEQPLLNLMIYQGSINAGEKVKIQNNYILLEGDWTNRTDIPDYFTGIQSVQDSVQIKSVGKNLFKPFGDSSFNGVTLTTLADGTIELAGTANGNFNPIKPFTLQKGMYTISCNNTGAIGDTYTNSVYLAFLDEQNEWATSLKLDTHNKTITSNIKNDVKKLMIVVPNGENVDGTTMKIQIEEGRTATAYEPYQETTMQIPLAEPLRALPNGVCDYIADGKIVRNIGKFTMTGVNSDTYYYSWTDNSSYSDTITRFNLNRAGVKSGSEIVCDKLPYIKNGFENIGIRTHGSEDMVVMFLLKTDIPVTAEYSVNMTLLTEYLSANPITIYYELATPIVEDLPIPNDSILQTYQNGHILLENTPVNPKVDVQYPIGLQGKILKLETEIAENEQILSNLFDANDVLDYWNGGNA